MSQLKETFTEQDFQNGEKPRFIEPLKILTCVRETALGYLDAELEKSKNIRNVRPIVLVAVGGYVSVKILNNRDSTGDIDYILDPRTQNEAKVNEKLRRAVREVASRRGYHAEWINDRVSGFVYDNSAQPLVERSVQQNVVLYRSNNLVVYAVEWEWSFARKLRRVATQGREVDIDDAARTLHIINQQRGHPMRRERARDYWQVVRSAIEENAINLVNQKYREKFGRDGFVLDRNGQGQEEGQYGAGRGNGRGNEGGDGRGTEPSRGHAPVHGQARGHASRYL